MANNLRKFATEAEYSAATLNYPAVSWVTSGDTLHYDLSGTTQSAPAVMLAFTTDGCCEDKSILIVGDAGMLDIVSAITVNGQAFEPLDSSVYVDLQNNTDYLIEFELMDNATDMSYYFNTNLDLEGCDYEYIQEEILFPEQVTNIGFIPSNLSAIILLPTTPPTTELEGSNIPECPIYVPDEAYEDYQETIWNYNSGVQPLSEYQGNLPI